MREVDWPDKHRHEFATGDPKDRNTSNCGCRQALADSGQHAVFPSTHTGHYVPRKADSASLVSRWEAKPGAPLKSERQALREGLRREMVKLKTERDILENRIK